MSQTSTSHPRQPSFAPDLGERVVKFARSNLAKATALVGVLTLACLVISGGISLSLAAASSVGLVGILILATVRNPTKILFILFVNACLLVVPKRDIGGVDVSALLSLVAAGLLTLSLASDKQKLDSAEDSLLENRRFDPVQYVLIGFGVLSIISTSINSQSLVSVIPWLSGISFALLIGYVPNSQLPSVSSARRTILVAGAVATVYDLYLLATGKALNVGTFNAGRFLGSLGDYELLAEFYGVVILLALTGIFFDKNRVWRLASGVLIVPSFFIILATQSRGPIILLCGVIPVLILISIFWLRESIGKILILTGCVALGLGAFIGTLSATPLFERLTTIQLSEGIDTAINRAAVWDYFTQLPKFIDLGIVGNGFDYPYEEIGTYPHSLYLWLLWSGGPALLICFVLLVLLLVGKLIRGIVLRHSASLSVAAVVGYILVDEVKIEAARTSPTVGFVWVFLSLAILAGRERRKL